MPALTAYVNPNGGRRHAFRDCPHLRPGYRQITIDAAFLDCSACKRRLAKAGQAGKEGYPDAR